MHEQGGGGRVTRGFDETYTTTAYAPHLGVDRDE